VAMAPMWSKNRIFYIRLDEFTLTVC